MSPVVREHYIRPELGKYCFFYNRAQSIYVQYIYSTPSGTCYNLAVNSAVLVACERERVDQGYCAITIHCVFSVRCTLFRDVSFAVIRIHSDPLNLGYPDPSSFSALIYCQIETFRNGDGM
jgi:hypothetical protein